MNERDMMKGYSEGTDGSLFKNLETFSEGIRKEYNTHGMQEALRSLNKYRFLNSDVTLNGLKSLSDLPVEISLADGYGFKKKYKFCLLTGTRDSVHTHNPSRFHLHTHPGDWPPASGADLSSVYNSGIPSFIVSRYGVTCIGNRPKYFERGLSFKARRTLHWLRGNLHATAKIQKDAGAIIDFLTWSEEVKINMVLDFINGKTDWQSVERALKEEDE